MDHQTLDVLPAAVTITPGKVFRRARVVFNNGVAKLLIVENNRVVEKASISDAELTVQGSRATIQSLNETWTVQRTNGCNCGGLGAIKRRLAAHDPWAQEVTA